MSQHSTGDPAQAGEERLEDIERLLVEGVHLVPPAAAPRAVQVGNDEAEDAEDDVALEDGDVQGAIGLFAEAAQDMATAGVELGLGRHFACVDFCNQAAEKAAQSVSLLSFGHRTAYDHDLGKLGEAVGAPPDIQEAMAALSPFHPEAFYAGTPPEVADEVIDADQATTYLQSARRVLRWARSIVLA